jgi:diadenosine tetraphosphate (Ap4A) HIT family hydrolase
MTGYDPDMPDPADRPLAERPTCPECGFDLWIPLARLEVSTLGLYDDGRFPGRCILMLDEHFDHMDELPDDVLAAFARDQKRVGWALRTTTGCERINYAVLGNTLPHVHCHIIPRYADDPVPTRPPWEHPDKSFKNDPELRERLIVELKAALARG